MSEHEGFSEDYSTGSVRTLIEKYENGGSIIPGHFDTGQPSVASDVRGILYRREGATGVADKLLTINKNALNAYGEKLAPVFGNDIIILRNNAAVTLGNVTTAQSPFTAANDTISVEAATLYEFEAMLATVQGTTSHTVAFGFGGTATFTDCAYYSEHISVTDATLASNDVDNKWTKVATATVITPAITATGTIIWLRGSFLINAAGTLIPQITFSADPTGTCECHIGSFFRAWRLPSAAVGPLA